MQIEQTETEIQSGIMTYLTATLWDVYRMNSGRIRGVRMHKPGTPDILAEKLSISVWWEVKKPGEYPTKVQKKRHKELRANGFLVYVVRSVSDVKKIEKYIFGKYLKKLHKYIEGLINEYGVL